MKKVAYILIFIITFFSIKAFADDINTYGMTDCIVVRGGINDDTFIYDLSNVPNVKFATYFWSDDDYAVWFGTSSDSAVQVPVYIVDKQTGSLVRYTYTNGTPFFASYVDNSSTSKIIFCSRDIYRNDTLFRSANILMKNYELIQNFGFKEGLYIYTPQEYTENSHTLKIIYKIRVDADSSIKSGFLFDSNMYKHLSNKIKESTRVWVNSQIIPVDSIDVSIFDPDEEWRTSMNINENTYFATVTLGVNVPYSIDGGVTLKVKADAIYKTEWKYPFIVPVLLNERIDSTKEFSDTIKINIKKENIAVDKDGDGIDDITQKPINNTNNTNNNEIEPPKIKEDAGIIDWIKYVFSYIGFIFKFITSQIKYIFNSSKSLFELIKNIIGNVLPSPIPELMFGALSVSVVISVLKLVFKR